jgi:hypothetical protein
VTTPWNGNTYRAWCEPRDALLEELVPLQCGPGPKTVANFFSRTAN